MSRRGLTFALATAVVVVLGVLATVLPVPYVIFVPGPVTDTLRNVPGTGGTTGHAAVPVVSVSGARTYPVSGRLYLTTVGIEPGDCSHHPTLWQAVQAWFDSTQSVEPQQVECAPGESSNAVRQQQVQDMTNSQHDAVTAALLHLGYKPTSENVVIGATIPRSPAAAVLKTGDALLSIDGTKVTGLDQLRTLITAHPAGTTLTLAIRRGGSTSDVHITTVPVGPTRRPTIGIDLTTLDLRATFATPHVRIGINPNDVGGPSAGLAFTLGIIDKLTPGSLTGGRIVAGTGTIDGFGRVGPIGGIQQKIAAAVHNKASVFLAPAGDCADARAAAPKSLVLVRVDTLATAVSALHAIVSGTGTFPRC